MSASSQNSLRDNTFLGLTALLIFALLISSCAPSAAPASPTATLIPPPTLTPTVTPTPFVPKAVIKIASHSPLSGDYAPWGTDIMRAVELAARQLVEPLHALGYGIKLVSYDDQSSLDVAVPNANEIIADPEILCAVGHYFSAITIQTAEIYHKGKLPFICPSCTRPQLTDAGYLETNRVAGRDDNQGRAGAQFVNAQGLTDAFVISQNNTYALKNADFFRQEARQLGIILVGDMKTDLRTGFESFISRVMENEADVVYFSSLDAEQVGEFIREARAAGYLGMFLGPDGLNNPALATFAGPLMVDGAGAYYTSPTPSVVDIGAASEFVHDFETSYGSLPHEFAAQAYDAAGICLKAIEQASIAKNGEIPTRTEVANAIRSLTEYAGITGSYTFSKKGEPNLTKYYIYQVTSVDPNRWSENPLVASYEIAPP